MSSDREKLVLQWLEHCDSTHRALYAFQSFLVANKADGCSDQQFMSMIQELAQNALIEWMDSGPEIDELRESMTGITL